MRGCDKYTAHGRRPGAFLILRRIYCSTWLSEQVQRPLGWPYQPQRQGFMAHTSMNRLGSVSVPAARVMVTKPSSSGWRSVSSADLSNSGSSSRNSTPLWASEISPGRGVPPPPASDTVEAVWWGLRKGRTSTSGWAASVIPATE